jgi:hypothetical protein
MMQQRRQRVLRCAMRPSRHCSGYTFTIMVLCDSFIKSALLQKRPADADAEESDAASLQDLSKDSDSEESAVTVPSSQQVSRRSKKQRAGGDDETLAVLAASLAALVDKAGGAAASSAVAVKTVGCLFAAKPCDCALTRADLERFLGVKLALGTVCPECDHPLSKHSA